MKPFQKLISIVGSLLILSVLLAACGDSSLVAPDPDTHTSSSATPTSSSAIRTMFLDNDTPKAEIAPITVGKELIGQSLAIDSTKDLPQSYDLRIVDVANFKSFAGHGEIFTPQNGIYIAVLYQVANIGANPGPGIYFSNVVDKNGQPLTHFYDYAAAQALNSLDSTNYPFNTETQPGLTTRNYLLFDVSPNVSGLKLVAKEPDTLATRTPFSGNPVSGIPTRPTTASLVSNLDFGKELVGQIISADDPAYDIKLDIRATGIETKTEFASDTGPLRSSGVFLLIFVDIANLGSRFSDFPYNLVRLQDKQGRKFNAVEDTDYYTAVQALSKLDADKYPLSLANQVDAGFVRSRLVLFDLPANATDLKLVPHNLSSSVRQVDPAEFSNSGGSGADSGAGQELIGKSFTSKNGVTITINKFKRYTQLTNYGKAFASTDGVFLVVGFDVRNASKNPIDAGALQFTLTDQTGQTYQDITYYPYTPDFLVEFPDDTPNIAAGSTGRGFGVIEIPKDARNLTIQNLVANR